MKKHLISALILGSLMSTNAFAELSKEQTQQLEEINQFLKDNPSTISGLHTSLEQYVAGQEQAKKAQAESHDWLYNNDAHPITWQTQMASRSLLTSPTTTALSVNA